MTKPPKIHVTARIAPAGVEWLDRIADEHKVDRSDVIRAALKVASRDETQIHAVLNAL
jgi:hypothetical protein